MSMHKREISTKPPKLVLCKYCLEVLDRKSDIVYYKNKKFCSIDCQSLYIEELKYKKKEKEAKVCKCCGKTYLSGHSKQIFCSKDCIKNYYKNIHISDFTTNRFVIFERDKFRCIYCGKSSIEDKKELRIEHIIPRSKGGNNNLENIVTSCISCNLEKLVMILGDNIINRIVTEVKKRNETYFKGKNVKNIESMFDKFYKYKKAD